MGWFGRRHRAPQTAEAGHDDTRALDAAWRVHDKVAGATSAVDAKASFLFAVQSAAIVVVLTLSDEKWVLSRVETPLEQWLRNGGVGLLLAGAALSAIVVVPKLRMWATRRRAREWRTGVVYFGHLRHWDPAALEAAFRDGSVLLPTLSHQLVRMSKIAWLKHVLAKVSMYVTFAGLAAIGGAAALVLWC